jgi:hypothetical protein
MYSVIFNALLGSWGSMNYRVDHKVQPIEVPNNDSTRVHKKDSRERMNCKIKKIVIVLAYISIMCTTLMARSNMHGSCLP